jgi:hypothetical protein
VTVYDLDKLAKPSPWKDNTGKGKCVNCPGVVQHDDDWVCIVQDDESRKATNILICHIRNNYLKALDALKYDVDPSRVQHSDECTSRSPDSPPQFIDENCNCWVADRKKLIKELETV